jgi:PTS system N-acetylgalactosamine-specific IIA component
MSKLRALIAGHGDFASGIISAAVQITGRDDVFASLSNRGLSAADVAAAMSRMLDESGARVVFTDLPAGSCTMAARRLQRDRPGLVVVVGVNLATLLDFIFDDAEDGAAARNAATKGRDALLVLGDAGVPRGA